MKNKIFLVVGISALLILSISLVSLASTKISDDTKNQYKKLYSQQDAEFLKNENQFLTIASEKNSAEKESKLKKNLQKAAELKKQPQVLVENAKKDSYTEDYDIVSTKNDLQKDLQNTLDVCSDMKMPQDSPLYEHHIKKIQRLQNLIEKVKNADEKDFSKLMDQRNNLYNDFQREVEAINKSKNN